jgi:hypothetical protein
VATAQWQFERPVAFARFVTFIPCHCHLLPSPTRAIWPFNPCILGHWVAMRGLRLCASACVGQWSQCHEVLCCSEGHSQMVWSFCIFTISAIVVSAPYQPRPLTPLALVENCSHHCRRWDCILCIIDERSTSGVQQENGSSWWLDSCS